MLYYLHYLTEWFTPLRVFRYITFRALAGAATAFLITIIVGPPMIAWLRRIKSGETKRFEGVADHLHKIHSRKSGTPSMGGLLIILSVTISTLLWANPANGYVLLTLATMIAMGAVGFADDYLKMAKKQRQGLAARKKLAAEVCWGFFVAGVLLIWPESRDEVRKLMVPFLKDPLITDMGIIASTLFIVAVIVSVTNAVNLTDGLDGLAIGCSNSAAAAYLALAYVAGNVIFAEYLQVPYIPGSGELTVFCGCLLGAGLGFLWFNCHPAQVFMGDTGSLALGGSIAMVAIAIRQELLLIVVGGVFVIEAVSVILQVASYQLTGKRIFRCSPIHHHFELIEKERAEREGRDKEVIETMITIRFWILAIIFALLGIATLKLR